MNPSSILLVGCGKMGGSLLTRWQRTHPADIRRFRIIDPHIARANTEFVSWFKSIDELPAAYVPSVVVFAVKPQELGALLPAFHERFVGRQLLYLSIAAGKTLKFYRANLGDQAHVVRAMPNTPALVGEGMTVLCSSANVPASGKDVATKIMQAVGHTVWIEDESQMDAVTALSGSGPAYVFLFLECLTKAGIASGLSEDTARQLAIATMAGSTSLANQSSDSFETLRKNVTSPGGTTEAALQVLMNDNLLEDLIKDAVLRAHKRSKELSEQ
jgi:pyrroline-5-carboxylate reductase